jgi:hypothetical protein
MALILFMLLFELPVALAEDPPGYAWKHCERADLNGATIPFNPDGTFRPECAPDVLYSWQRREKLMGYKGVAGLGRPMNFPYLYTWRTPIMTVTYGHVQLRIKLKKGVKFVPIDEDRGSIHRQCNGDEIDTIHVGYTKTGVSEYILCSPSVVESWSYDTPEATREMEREQQWVTSHGRESFDLFVRDLNRDWLAEHVLNEGGYSQRLAALKSSGSKGEIFYADGVPKDRARHFSSKFKSYFNPGVSPPPHSKAATDRTEKKLPTEEKRAGAQPNMGAAGSR